MAGSKKSTKKFEKKHLKDVLERRKGVAKIKQRQQLKAKRKARQAQDERHIVDDLDGKEEPSSSSAKNGSAGNTLKNMTVDDFFQGGFDIPEPKKGNQNAKKLSSKRKLDDLEDEEMTSAGSEDSISADRVLSESEHDSETDSGSDSELHKRDLEALAEKDPEFYNYLKENDAELLEFEDDDGLVQLSDSSEPLKKKTKGSSNSAPPQEVDDEAKVVEPQDGQKVSKAVIVKWKNAMVDQHSLRAMREIVLAFRAAAHSSDEEEKRFKYIIASPETYHQVLITALQYVPAVLQYHIPIKETASGRVRVPTDSKKYKALSPVLNSHALAILHLLENLSDPSTLKLTLSSLLPLLPYLLSFKKVLKNLLKAVVGVWSDASTSEATRINAFLIVRRLAAIGDSSQKEVVLKATYQGLIRGSRNTSVHNLPGINLMKNSAAELWGLDHTLGYTTGFTYIRQLAIHLRSSISQPTKDSYKAIYNWQYVHSLDFWSRVLSTHCSPSSNLAIKKTSDSELHPLIYPLVQITLGALRLIPTPIYFPLRFHLTRSLLRISRSTHTYIPLASALIEVLQSPEMKESSKPSTQKALDFTTSLRAPKSYLRTKVYQDGLGEQVTELLAEFFGVWAKNIAFPELLIPPSVLLKRWVKEVSTPPGKSKKASKAGNRNYKLNSSIQLLLQKLAANAAYVEERRAKVDFAVSDRDGVEGFLKDVEFEDLPIGAFVVGVRKQREERERILEEARKEDEKRRKNSEQDNNRESYHDSDGMGDDDSE